LYIKQGQLETAETTFQKALLKAKEFGGQELIATALFGLARVAAAQGKDGEAQQLGQESNAIFERMQHEKGLQVGLWMMAMADKVGM
jgi:tetratricopeptide (TPR) repeat protein